MFGVVDGGLVFVAGWAEALSGLVVVGVTTPGEESFAEGADGVNGYLHFLTIILLSSCAGRTTRTALTVGWLFFWRFFFFTVF